MAQPKNKRRRKRRGTQGGRIDTAGRRGRPQNRAEARNRARSSGKSSAAKKRDLPPTWKGSAYRGLFAAAVFVVILLVLFKRPVAISLIFGVFMLAFYIPTGYYIDMTMWRKRERQRIRDREGTPSPVALDVQMLTVGQIGENTYLFRPEGGDKLIVIDPGEEAERILAAIEGTGAEVEAILLTHTHFDHVGAVAPVARATGAPVYVPEIEKPVLADIMAYVPWEGFGPYESWDAEETLAGGETLELGGMTLDVIFTPGHSPGHVTYSVRGEDAIFSGDVLFQGSVGRVDLPGGDWPTLLASIETLLDSHSDETVVHPGHMGLTTLGAERATNPFLQASAR